MMRQWLTIAILIGLTIIQPTTHVVLWAQEGEAKPTAPIDTIVDTIEVSDGAADALILMPSFDASRVVEIAAQWSTPPQVTSVAEAAKLLFAMQRLPNDKLQQSAQIDATIAELRSGVDNPNESSQVDSKSLRMVIGRGRIARLVAIPLPAELSEVLELSRLYQLEVQPDNDQQPLTILVADAPLVANVQSAVDIEVGWAALEVVAGQSLLLAPRVTIHSAGKDAQWPVGWQLLAEDGFDIGRFDTVLRRGSDVIAASESDGFYGILRAASQLSSAVRQPSDSVPPAERVETTSLLRDPKAHVGHWIELDLETVRATRVVLDSDDGRRALGQDHYWQIDAIGELPSGLRIETPTDTGERLEYQNRFPATVVIARLPEWLQTEIGSAAGQSLAQVDMQMVRSPVRVRGFFYRLWSYDSEFAESRGGKQIAPLLIAADLFSRDDARVSERGVEMIGWIMATVVVSALIVVTWLLWRSERRDREVVRRRRAL